MVIESWLKINFSALAAEKDWSSLNDIEKQQIKNAIRLRLNDKMWCKLLSLCNKDESILELARNIAVYVGLDTKIYTERLFSLIMNHLVSELTDSSIESQIHAFIESIYPITYAKITGRPKGQTKKAAVAWDFTQGSLKSWSDNANFDSISMTQLEVKLEYLRKDEVGLLILYKFFDAESILKFMNTIKKKKLKHKAQIVDVIGYKNIQMQLDAIDTINPAVVNICNRVKDFMGDVDLFNRGLPTYYNIITSSLSAYYAEAELQGQSSAFIIFCDYISNQINQLCCMKIESKGKSWDWTEESLSSWVSKHPTGNSITLQTPTKETNKKLYLAFSLLVFSRADLSIWGVPAVGRKEAVFWGDAL